MPQSEAVISVTVMPDGTILGIGRDHYLYTRATLTSPWVQVPQSGGVIGVTTMSDGSILDVGLDTHLYTSHTRPAQPALLTMEWVKCIRPSKGTDGATAVATFGLALATAAAADGADGAKPVSAELYEQSKAAAGNQSVPGINTYYKGYPDDLYITLNDITVWPFTSYSVPIKSQETVTVNHMVPIHLDSNQSFTIGLWDGDTGSANDVLGYQHFIP